MSTRDRVVLGLAVLAFMASASGQERPYQETVTSRERPEIDPLGLRLGVWTLDASVSLGYLLDDNIFATRDDEVDDEILQIRPEVLLSSGWSRHSLRAGADATIARYQDYDSEDYEDSRVFVDGRLDMPRGDLSATLSQSELHDERTSPDDAGGLEPTTFALTEADLVWTLRPGAFLLRPNVRYRSFSFDDTPATAPADPNDRPAGCVPGGSPGIDVCSNEDRDREAIAAGLRIGYEVTAEFEPFIEGRATWVDYDRTADFEGYQRSSDGYEALAGSSFDLGGALFGEAYAGYRRWTFDDPRFETIDGSAFGADVTWNVTTLTTLVLGADRTIEATTIVGAAGIERTAFGLSADHELLRNLLLWAKASTASEDFEGIDRSDDITELGLGARYFLHRRVYVGLSLENETRDSSGADSSGQEYDITTIEIWLQGNL